MEILKVLKYIEDESYHICTDQNGNSRRIDLMASGSLPIGTNPAELTGKTVRIRYAFPFIECADGVELLPQKERQQLENYETTNGER